LDPVERAVFALAAPIITWPGMENLVTEEHRNNIIASRMAAAIENREEATDWEAMIYLHTASLATPLDHDHAQIYFYLFSKLLPQHAEKIGLPNVELNDYLSGKLQRLKEWIFRQQLKAWKKKRQARKRANAIPYAGRMR